MRIVISLLSFELGGMEQACVDHARALKEGGNEMIAIARRGAPYLKALREVVTELYEVDPYGYYDVRSWYHIWRLLNQINPRVIIAHGNRAIDLMRKGSQGFWPVVAVSHSNNMKRSIGSSLIVTVNEKMREKAVELGQSPSRTIVIPNMIQVPQGLSFSPRPFRTPIVIGAMGRFSKEKGFHQFIYALSLLNEKNIPFRAVLAGDGDLREELETLARTQHIADKITFTGWVEDKQAFFESIDVFCVPSRYETFGRVLLEAALYSTPMVVTPTEGANSVLIKDVHALMTITPSPVDIAEGLYQVLRNPDRAFARAAACFEHVTHEYSEPVVTKRLQEVLAVAA